MKFIFISKKVETCIAALNKADKAGRLVADKAKAIIDGLTSGTAQLHMDAIGSLTKYGEKRIRNCRKYDLSCGYRLITLRRGNTVFITFLGTHDDCQRWLENKSRLKDFDAGAGRTIRIIEKKPAKASSKLREGDDNIVDDCDLSEQYTDEDLRRVFSGLVQGLK